MSSSLNTRELCVFDRRSFHPSWPNVPWGMYAGKEKLYSATSHKPSFSIATYCLPAKYPFNFGARDMTGPLFNPLWLGESPAAICIPGRTNLHSQQKAAATRCRFMDPFFPLVLRVMASSLFLPGSIRAKREDNPCGKQKLAPYRRQLLHST